ncbi:peptide chain release factor 1 [Buchnera aphidicola]|uniref:peptide chain release factor 1 n=1 Tax=Buchnera aphidicola TaxID=9 RepID=UPI0030EF4602
MNKFIINKLDILENRYKELENLLSQRKIIKNKKKFINFSKEYLKISEIVNFFVLWKKNEQDILDVKDLEKDEEMKEFLKQELGLYKEKKNKLELNIKNLLIPKDDQDILNCFVEIKSASGGNEAAIFAGDLYKMYVRYSEINLWKTKIVMSQSSEYGGFKEILLKIIGKGSFGKLKFESGCHRVQRVPKTESQGRIHTSTCIIAVIPSLPSDKKLEVNVKDLKIDTFRSSGAGGQHVNTTDSAIRITHIPTGIVVECQDERSQHKNKAKALSVLSMRINQEIKKKKEKESSKLKKDLLGSGNRSDKNRTYNFPQNRVTDHRIHLTIRRLNEILNGRLDLLIEPALLKYQSKIFK